MTDPNTLWPNVIEGLLIVIGFLIGCRMLARAIREAAAILWKGK